MPNELEDIPSFLRLTREERREAWEKFRRERPLPVEVKPTYRPITDLPGANHGNDSDDT